jgi:D-glycerate 3-kinase
VEIPRFDKSLYDGEGDRLPLDGTGIIIKQPPTVDVVILEGWFIGFHPIPIEDLQSRWENIWKAERQKLGLPETVELADIKAVNDKLHEYLALWNFFDVFIQVSNAISKRKVYFISLSVS